MSARSNVSVVERQAEHIADIQNEIRCLNKAIKQVDILIESLGEDKHFIKDYYINELSKAKIAYSYGLTIRGVYKRKQRLLKNLELYNACTTSVRNIDI